MTERKAPWKKPAPKGTAKRKLSPADKAAARRRAEKAGRSYPNLIDNMQQAAKARRRAS